MSDTEDGGSFDKEAEKEKLREQLEREEENRAATQHMSELLLKGATMTNAHCEECGDPIFRHEGQEFCPTCGRTADGDGAAAEAGAAPETETTAETESSAAGAGAGDVEPGAGGVAASGDRDAETAGEPAITARRTAGDSTAGTSGGSSQPAAGGDLGDARAALQRTLATLARQAEATDDVGRTRELLAATREAAEALAALESIGR